MRRVLSHLGFANRWIHWVMMCVSSVNYSVMVNMDKVGLIYPVRGLGQGDSLFPYLFILVVEGLSTLINKAIARGYIYGVQICRGAPKVSHLLFGDDYFLFCRVNPSEVNHLMDILRRYVDASG